MTGVRHCDAVFLQSLSEPSKYALIACNRFGFKAFRDRFYFTLGEQQSDVWVAELAGGRQWMDARVPERLVRVDVPDPRRRTLVEEGRLDGRPPPCQRLAQRGRGERPLERLASQYPEHAERFLARAMRLRRRLHEAGS